jgi:phosphatidylglycerophosphatase A
MTISRKIGTSLTTSTNFGKFVTVLASGFGVGYTPYAPGTAGSLLGIGCFFLTRDFSYPVQTGLFLFFFLLGIGIAERAEKTSRQIDPGFIIIDEVAGMWISLLFLWKITWPVIIAGFILFRLFDILKFFPISIFESFHGGTGIMLDDLAAGMLVNFLLRILLLTGIM